MTAATRIPLPAGTVSADRWEVGEDERVTRYFHLARHGTAVRVWIMGQQDHSGEVLNRWIIVTTADGDAELDAATAREAAADLLAAADDLDGLR